MEGRYLLGVTDMEEARRYLKHECDTPISDEDLADRIRIAEAIRRARPVTPTPALAGDVPDSWRPHLEAVAARPLFRRLYDQVRWRFATVPTEGLITVQAHLNYSYGLQRAGVAPTEADILETCLPTRPEAMELWGGVTVGEPPSASFFTRDPNIQITAVQMETQPLRVTFTISKTAIFTQVVRLGGRLYLKNGTHRIVGLAARGVRVLPCVLVDVADVDDLPKLLPFRTLMGDTPPSVTDFLQPELYMPFTWQDRVKYIRLVPEMFSSPVPEPQVM